MLRTRKCITAGRYWMKQTCLQRELAGGIPNSHVVAERNDLPVFNTLNGGGLEWEAYPRLCLRRYLRYQASFLSIYEIGPSPCLVRNGANCSTSSGREGEIDAHLSCGERTWRSRLRRPERTLIAIEKGPRRYSPR